MQSEYGCCRAMRLVLSAGQERLLNAIVRHGGFRHLATAMGLNYMTESHKWPAPAVMATARNVSIECTAVESGCRPCSGETAGKRFKAGLEPRLVSSSGTGDESGKKELLADRRVQRSSRVHVEPVEAPQLQQLSDQVRSFLSAANGERNMGPCARRFPTGHQLKAAGAAPRPVF